MQDDVRRKTFLERVAETLPTPLKEAYDSAPRKSSDAHEILRLLVSKYLWDNGYRSISFETSINCGCEENMCIDIHERTLGLFIECERNPERKAISDRRRAVMDVYPTAKFVLATQDRMGWRALKLTDVADEVWVVCRDGRVLTPTEWAEERCKTLKSIFNRVELEGYLNLYRRADEDYHRIRMLSGEEELFWRQILTNACMKTSQFQADWLKDINVKGVWSKQLENARKRMEEAKFKIIVKVVELLNAILALSSPYIVKFTEDAALTVEVDWDAWQWLGWRDYPRKEPEAATQYQILEENLQRELKIATKNVNKRLKGTCYPLKQKIERDQIIEELKKEVAEIKNALPLLVEKLRKSAATQSTIV
ncbi:MAG: hypothetical protein RMJ15_03465 [Nitrososphaerota archaeon]|nr:hypothetical protein [Nitrososphaerota archaeon]